jgi:hypothetical protein
MKKSAPVHTSIQDRPCEKEASKVDFSFVRHPTLQDALWNVAQYERQLTQELSHILSLLPRTRTKTKKSGNSGGNRVEHPMASYRMVIDGEDTKQFERLRTDFERQLKPQTPTERELVERIVALSWRSRRVPAFETALMEAARIEFKAPSIKRELWAIDSPNHPLLGYGFQRDGKPATMTAAEREREWNKKLAWRKQIEDRTSALLGDEKQDILPDLWFMRGRDIQEKVGKLARYEAALARQLACTRKLLHLMRARRKAEVGPD